MQNISITMKRCDYSEAQSWKSYCDDEIAHMRSKMSIFSLEGHTIYTTTQTKKASLGSIVLHVDVGFNLGYLLECPIYIFIYIKF